MEQEIKVFDTLAELLVDLDKEGITGYQKQKKVEEFLYLKARVKKIPFAGSFELTPLCNLDCKMCYVHLSKGQVKNEQLVSTEQWIDIIRQAVDAGMMYADITGGECLTHPGFKEIYKYMYSRGVRITVLSNGALIDKELVSFFQQYKPALIQISLYGSNGDAYKRVTGHDVFDSVVRAIRLLKEAQLRCRIAITPSIFMADDKNDILDFVRSLEIDYALGTVSLPARPDTGRDISTIAVENNVYVDMRINDEAYRSKLPKAEKSKSYNLSVRGLETSGIPCASGRCSFHINWKAEMMPCIPFYTIRKSIARYGYIGAWREVQKEMAAFQHPQECANCKHKDICTTCPAEKTKGILNGKLNTNVCDRLNMVMEKCYGIIDK